MVKAKDITAQELASASIIGVTIVGQRNASGEIEPVHFFRSREVAVIKSRQSPHLRVIGHALALCINEQTAFLLQSSESVELAEHALRQDRLKERELEKVLGINESKNDR